MSVAPRMARAGPLQSPWALQDVRRCHMHRPGRRLLEGGEGRRCRFCTPIFWGQLVHDFLVGGFKHGFYIFQKIYGDVIRQPLTNSIIFQAVFVVNLCEMMTSWRKWLNFSEHFFHHDVSKLVFF